MPVESANVVRDLRIVPEIHAALEAIQLPEVQDLMRQLAKFNLGVCVPHMHGADVDFEVLPAELVQVEENCEVRWVPRSELNDMVGHVPVAWRWADDGLVAMAQCIATCTPDPKSSHRKGHLK